MLKFFKRKKDKNLENKQNSDSKPPSTVDQDSLSESESSTGEAPEIPSEVEQSVSSKAETSQPPVESQDHPLEIAEEDLSKTESDAKPENQNSQESQKRSFFGRLKDSLSKTRKNLTSGIANLFLGKKTIDDELLDELETQLIMADVGVDATEDIIEEITQGISRKEIKDPQAVLNALKQSMLNLLKPCEAPLTIPESTKPYVILMVGVNGSGKTTTIGKLTKKLQSQGKKVMLAAGDTFRAAATEQLQVWGERNDVPVIAQHSGADSASVVYDGFAAAKAREFDVLIADTAGRLHTRDNLMDELKKVTRVLKKMDPNVPHETMLVVDASTGQNALVQAIKFHDAVGLSGITLTKIDGTAKGGIIFAIAKKLKLPIRYLGCGEKIEDLRQFKADDFIEALFTDEKTKEPS